MYAKGASQIVPFVITILAILFTDLLIGMAIGMLFGLFYVVRSNFQSAISLTRDGSHYLLRLQKDVSFLNKAPLRQALAQIEAGSYVIVDGTRAKFIDRDIIETLEDFIAGTGENQVRVEIKNIAALRSDLHPALATTSSPTA